MLLRRMVNCVARLTGSRTLKRRTTFCAMVLPVIIAATYCHYDTQALPRAVDILSGVVGDKTILAAEKTYYGASGWVNERMYSAKLALGLAKQHKLAVYALPKRSEEVKTSVAETLALERESRTDGEGQWLDKGSYLKTFVYPEPKLDSIADIVMFKPEATSIHLVCGTKEPLAGGTGRIPDVDRASVVVAFSGGFKYRHDHGGMALDGKVLQPMRDGLGTLVIFRDGRIKIGKWGRDWSSISPQMRDLRQGFMLVDKGAFCDSPLFNVYSQDKKTYVRRSGLGVTCDGALVYATGNNLSAEGLAQAMIAAGVVSAVNLEMNMSRVVCGAAQREGGGLTFVPLTPRCCDPASLAGTRERDFMYITRRDSARQCAAEGG